MTCRSAHFFTTVALTVSPVTEAAVPAEGAVPTVHGAQEAGAPRRGEHQHAVPVPPQPLLPLAPHGPGHGPGQELRGGEHTHLLRLLLPEVDQG